MKHYQHNEFRQRFRDSLDFTQAAQRIGRPWLTLGGAIYHCSIYPDGSIEAVNRCHVLVPTKPKLGGLRAWETPGLKRRRLKTLGVKTTDFMTKDGERWDYYRYEEGKDRALRA